MKAGTIVKSALALLVVAGATYAIKPDLFEPYLPEGLKGLLGSESSSNKPATARRAPIGIIRGAEWVDCTAVRDKVAAEIMTRVGNMSDAAVAEFITKPENRLLLAQWVVADAELRGLEDEAKAAEKRTADLEKLQNELTTARAAIPEGVEPPAAVAYRLNELETKISRLEAEIAAAHLLSQSAAGKGGSRLMERIGDDPEWLGEFAFSGECVRPGMALAILKLISKDNPDMVSNSMVRSIATATALEYAKSGWNIADAVERANFYIQSWKNERLNTVFDTLPMWQRRMVCGCKGDNPYGSISSLTWSQENMSLPADRYSGCCWRCSYRLNNIYGDSIHGPMYYAPFEGSLGTNRAAMTFHIGGVCGSLSHFGAFAALANGVPAMTMGEPGHCAYLVLVGDKWTPAYSLTWDRGLHWQIFRNVYSFSSLHSATELYSEAQKEQTSLSNAWRVLAGIKMDAGDPTAAISCYERSLRTQPRNWMAWREWMEVLTESNASADSWDQLNTAICTHLVPLYPEMAYELMQKGMVDGMAKAMADSPERLRKALLLFWQSIDTMGPDRWHIERLANKQIEALGLKPAQPEALCAYYSDVLGILISNSKYAPTILNWGNTLSDRMDSRGKGLLTQAMISAIGKNDNMSAEDRIALLSPAVLAAEKNHDLTSFQAIGRIIEDMGHVNTGVNMPSFQPFPGKLASEGGLTWMSSTSRWDKPHEHPGLLLPHGGTFHTAKDKDAFVVVQLPRQVNVTGVVLILTPGNIHRCNNMVIQVSENGTDWTDVKEVGTCRGRVMRVDLGDKLPLAKYVRILRRGGPEFFHLNGIYIYGNQAA